MGCCHSKQRLRENISLVQPLVYRDVHERYTDVADADDEAASSQAPPYMAPSAAAARNMVGASRGDGSPGSPLQHAASRRPSGSSGAALTVPEGGPPGGFSAMPPATVTVAVQPAAAGSAPGAVTVTPAPQQPVGSLPPALSLSVSGRSPRQQLPPIAGSPTAAPVGSSPGTAAALTPDRASPATGGGLLGVPTLDADRIRTPSLVAKQEFIAELQSKLATVDSPQETHCPVYVDVPISKNYALGKTLGRGGFAVCRLATELSSGRQWAIKVVNLRALKLSEDRWMVENEVQILRRVHHPNIVSLHEVYLTVDTMALVLDLCRGGELFEEVVKRGHFSEESVRMRMQQIMSAVAYLHDIGVIHRDLKPENILLLDRTEDSPVQITDFGLAGLIRNNKEMNEYVGTMQYMAPEVILGHDYGPEVDVWSCGVVMFVLLAGYLPFDSEDEEQLVDNILECRPAFDRHPAVWEEVTPLARDMLSQLLVRDPQKRISAAAALNHPWFKNRSREVHLGSAMELLAAYNARRKLKAAVNTVRAVTRLKGASSNSSFSQFLRSQQSGLTGDTPLPTPPSSVVDPLSSRADSMLKPPTGRPAAGSVTTSPTDSPVSSPKPPRPPKSLDSPPAAEARTALPGEIQTPTRAALPPMPTAAAPQQHAQPTETRVRTASEATLTAEHVPAAAAAAAAGEGARVGAEPPFASVRRAAWASADVPPDDTPGPPPETASETSLTATPHLIGSEHSPAQIMLTPASSAALPQPPAPTDDPDLLKAADRAEEVDTSGEEDSGSDVSPRRHAPARPRFSSLGGVRLGPRPESDSAQGQSDVKLVQVRSGKRVTSLFDPRPAPL